MTGHTNCVSKCTCTYDYHQAFHVCTCGFDKFLAGMERAAELCWYKCCCGCEEKIRSDIEHRLRPIQGGKDD